MTDVADALFAAHVEHELSRLRGDSLGAILDEWVSAVFLWLEDVKFDDVVTREQILGVIERYVIELKVSGGITELAGEMSNVVFSSRSSGETRVREVVSADAFEEFADKIAALGGVHRELTRFVIRSNAFNALASGMFARMLLEVVFSKGDALPGAAPRGLLSALSERILPGLERRVAAAVSRHLDSRSVRLPKAAEDRVLQALDPELVRAVADEIWDSVSGMPLTAATAFFAAQDLEDFVVLGYEFWLKFRKTPYFRAVTGDVVTRLFEKYGAESLSSVIADMGVTEQMVANELRTFAAPIVEHAIRTGFLEQQLRTYLEPFYRSQELAKILGR